MSNNYKMNLKEIDNKEFDILVIGGGATGLGIAVDATTRGYKTLLIEKFDFAKGTSSRSSKLIHGGVRYLAQKNIPLVTAALHEKALLEKNAPHLVNECPFVTPIYNIFEVPYYYPGLSFYHELMGEQKNPKYETKILSKEETIAKIPNIKKEGLHCSVLYYDDSFDDARMAISLLRTFIENGGFAFNYSELTSFDKENGKIVGACIDDIESKESVYVKASCIINATGIFSDVIRKLDDANAANIISPSQGTHLVIKKDKFNTDFAMLIPKTTDNRVLFAVPWHSGVVCGSTDVKIDKVEEEPKALESEIEFILENMNNHLDIKLDRSDVKSVYTGIRPLIIDPDGEQNTSKISRDEKIFESSSGLITIAGGKYTTYRKMAEKAIEKAIESGLLLNTKSITEGLKIHGYMEKEEVLKIPEPYRVYGSDFNILEKMDEFNNKIHKDLDLNEAQINFSIDYEKAKTVDDILSRRTRSLLLNPKASIEAAKTVAEIMAKKLGKDKAWENEQVSYFTKIAKNYLV